jgi:uncharacterized surface protein with fasciclin (FAS1) repeats
MRTTHSRRAAVSAAVAGLALTLAACGGGDSTSSTDPGSAESSEPTMSPESSPSMSAGMSGMAQTFGTACSAVPADGPGSFSGMAMDPVATAASNNPALSTLVGAVKSAGLVDTLNTAQDITVFAPANDAFAKVDKATLDAAMADPQGLLTTVLTYHVVPGTLTPQMLAGEHMTLQGGTVTVAGSGEDFTVNDSAKVVCGNVQTDNATVYIIDGVLLPAS